MAEWRTIRRWPNYEVSNDGRVRNKFGRELYVDMDRVGYLRVKLYQEGIKKNRRIHVLVAQEFLNWYKGCDVDHIDGDKTNNGVRNLRITTHQENCLYRSQNARPYYAICDEPPF